MIISFNTNRHFTGHINIVSFRSYVVLVKNYIPVNILDFDRKRAGFSYNSHIQYLAIRMECFLHRAVQHDIAA